MRTAAVLPIKSFGRAKQRLRAAVAQPGRADLAAAMVGDVLAALNRVPGLDDLVVVTAEPRAAAAAQTDGAHVVHDPAETGQSDAAALGVAAALARGAERALLVPGDCPALDPREVAALLASATGPADTAGPIPAGRGGTVVIVPDRHGTGTNALLLSPPRAIAPAFGPGSFARHRARAAAAGAAVRVAAAPSLELDVDTPGDLAALRAALDRRPHAAPRTRALLARIAAAA